MQFKGKLMNQTLKNGENLISGPISAHVAQIWAPKSFFVGFISTNSYTLFQAIPLWNFQEN